MAAPDERSPRARARQLWLGLLFGILFGFLLQKGGVGKYHILIGQLLLEDWTVVKVMATAILVGMLGVFMLNALGLVKLHLKPTRLGANIIGGLIFGVGFGLSAYCPGTNMTALGQGNWDAVAVAAGMLVGSYLFAELSGWLSQTVEKWGDKGKEMLPDVLHIPRGAFIVGFAVVLGGLLIVLERFAGR